MGFIMPSTEMSNVYVPAVDTNRRRPSGATTMLVFPAAVPDNRFVVLERQAAARHDRNICTLEVPAT